MMPVLAVNKAAISLAAIFAIAVLVGCSSPSPGDFEADLPSIGSTAAMDNPSGGAGMPGVCGFTTVLTARTVGA
jgi:hypothetical protein